jgi:hypothetical protein
MRTNIFVDHGRFPLWAGRNSLCSSPRTPAERYTCKVKASYDNLHILASNSVLLLILADSSFTDDV